MKLLRNARIEFSGRIRRFLASLFFLCMPLAPPFFYHDSDDFVSTAHILPMR